MGAESIEVCDNGSGIDPSNYANIALKHHTSKLADFNDLNSMSSFGFRGEALNALCELSGTVVRLFLILYYLELKHRTIIFVRLRISSNYVTFDTAAAFAVTTKLDSEGVGCRIVFGRNGNIISETQVARTTGTTVLVTNLFEALPVRRGEFLRTIKKQFQKMVKVLQSYAIIAVGVRIVVTNVGKVRNVSLILPNSEIILYLQLSQLSNRIQTKTGLEADSDWDSKRKHYER